MTDRYRASAQYMTRARRVIPGGVSSAPRADQRPTPVAFRRADGARVVDLDGNEYLDYVLAWAPMILGHRPPIVLDAITRQLETGLLFGRQHEGEAALAERIASMVPGVDMTAFFSSGSEAVHAALGLAQAVTGRRFLVKFEGHYHGWIYPMAVNLPGMAAGEGDPPFKVLPAVGFPASPDVLVAPWNDLDALAAIFDRHGEQVAAVIMEPVAVNGGVLEPRDGYLEAASKVCHQHGALLIFDEIITGFRLGTGGAQGLFGVNPDISVFAKAMASGFPISAIGATVAVMDAGLRAGYALRGTYNGGPLPVAAALATMECLDSGSREIYPRLATLGARLADGLRYLADRARAPLVVNQVGSILSLMWGAPDPTSTYAEVLRRDPLAGRYLDEALLDAGIHTVMGERMYLSTAHDEADIDHTIGIAERAFAAVSDRLARASEVASAR